MLFKLEGFKYTMSLDLDMGYYHIQLSEDASNFCTIILLCGNTIPHIYQWELATNQIFQQKINDLLQGFGFIHVYIYDFYFE